MSGDSLYPSSSSTPIDVDDDEIERALEAELAAVAELDDDELAAYGSGDDDDLSLSDSDSDDEAVWQKLQPTLISDTYAYGAHAGKVDPSAEGRNKHNNGNKNSGNSNGHGNGNSHRDHDHDGINSNSGSTAPHTRAPFAQSAAQRELQSVFDKQDQRLQLWESEASAVLAGLQERLADEKTWAESVKPLEPPKEVCMRRCDCVEGWKGRRVEGWMRIGASIRVCSFVLDGGWLGVYGCAGSSAMMANRRVHPRSDACERCTSALCTCLLTYMHVFVLFIAIHRACVQVAAAVEKVKEEAPDRAGMLAGLQVDEKRKQMLMEREKERARMRREEEEARTKR